MINLLCLWHFIGKVHCLIMNANVCLINAVGSRLAGTLEDNCYMHDMINMHVDEQEDNSH